MDALELAKQAKKRNIIDMTPQSLRHLAKKLEDIYGKS